MPRKPLSDFQSSRDCFQTSLYRTCIWIACIPREIVTIANRVPGPVNGPRKQACFDRNHAGRIHDAELASDPSLQAALTTRGHLDEFSDKRPHPCRLILREQEFDPCVQEDAVIFGDRQFDLGDYLGGILDHLACPA